MPRKASVLEICVVNILMLLVVWFIVLYAVTFINDVFVPNTVRNTAIADYANHSFLYRILHTAIALIECGILLSLCLYLNRRMLRETERGKAVSLYIYISELTLSLSLITAEIWLG